MSARDARRRRHAAILRLLAERPIARQSALAEALAAEGHRVTQSTLSRDLKDLRVLRVASEDGYRYLPAGAGPLTAAPAPGMRSVAAAEVLEVEANETLVVVRTQVGRASGVAAFLDSQRLEGVLATVAGDDAILVVPSTVGETRAVTSRLRALFS